MSSDIDHGDILRADLINHSLAITAVIIRMQVLFEGGPYMEIRYL